MDNSTELPLIIWSKAVPVGDFRILVSTRLFSVGVFLISSLFMMLLLALMALLSFTYLPSSLYPLCHLFVAHCSGGSVLVGCSSVHDPIISDLVSLMLAAMSSFCLAGWLVRTICVALYLFMA